MILRNIYHPPEPIDNSARIPFNTLKYGDRYKHTQNGNISTVHFKCPEYITVRDHDNWLRRCTPDMDIWNKMVVKV